ncbi:hypothetical protein DRE_05246 [Drechslerella stenobrocha 248]|uniref:Ferric oxidoreductase domain-containing protein n=1 Tax=Drechslerella stenobrocha 248 TaxID=1043628 RepID=W7I9H4_9PEZI|nr:hypothetical protein DRE_05246 [Drechslerella stenobrocha 248]
MSQHSVLRALAVICYASSLVAADGNGLIGWGKTMYDPTCAFACRGVISKCTLLCTPKDSTANHGSHHNPVSTPPECFTSDNAFMRTMALCISTYCPPNGAPPLSQIEDYWYSHLGTGSIGNYKYVPTISYTEALLAAREDEANGVMPPSNTTSGGDEHSGHQMIRARHEGAPEAQVGTVSAHHTLPTIRAKQPLNVTSVIAAKDWMLQYNGMRNFELNENGHSTYGITLVLVALSLPVLTYLLRYIPGLARLRTWTHFSAIFNYPALWGTKHRAPVAMIVGGGVVPTRGQALYITVISVLNIVFLAAPYVTIQPQSIFGSWKEQSLSVIGCRAGSLALGNMVAMFVFSSRNNVLLYITNWSHDTFLLLHRWLGYWTIIQTVLHSILLLLYYQRYGDYAAELTQLYWIWGIVGTVAAVALWPFSLLAIRQKAYEFFLASHVVLAALFIIGYYYHIWYCFQYKWGYEIWAFIPIAIWATDRIWRLARMFYHGWRTARVTTVEGSNGEYLRIEIDGTQVDDVVYLCFPTLSWAFWQTHPFSVVSSFASRDTTQKMAAAKLAGNHTEKQDDIEITTAAAKPADSESNSKVSHASSDIVPRATIICRKRGGLTARLAARLEASTAGGLCLPVFVEGPYPSNAISQLSHCTTVLCIAGGVGITAILPCLQTFHAPRQGRLFWGVRHSSLVDALATEMADLPESVDITAILRDELAGWPSGGPIGVVVCGPAGLADEVRYQVADMTRRGITKASFTLVDLAFSW